MIIITNMLLAEIILLYNKEKGIKMYKSSKYNFIWPIQGNNNLLVYNSFSNKFEEIIGDKRHLLESSSIDLAALDVEDHITALNFIKKGFLIQDSYDELKVLRYYSSYYKYDRDALSLTIAPTLACNFQCPYCYEKENTLKNMTDEIQQAIFKYIQESVQKTKKVLITWYGGEPLLMKDTVVNMSTGISNLAAENNCECSFYMITNGYLLDEDLILKLKQFNFKGIQTTLDGPPHIHDKRRIVKGKGKNEGSFYKILENIKHLIKHDMKVYIRINVDQTNIDSIDELLDILASEGVTSAIVYPGQILAYTEACKSVEDSCVGTHEFANYFLEFNQKLMEKGFSTDLTNLWLRRKTNFCCADQINSFLIDCEGFMYKCWSQIGDKRNSVGNIMNLKSNRDEKMRHIQWLMWNPFDHEECRTCNILPLCMGGCPYLGINCDEGKPQCINIKHNIEKIVKTHYSCSLYLNAATKL